MEKHLVLRMVFNFTGIRNLLDLAKFRSSEDLDLAKFRSSDDLFEYLKTTRDVRLSFEKKIVHEFADKENRYLDGFCESCEKQSKFLLDWKYSDGLIPNFRERLVCESCGLNNRQRFMIGFLKKLATTNQPLIKDIYLYEQITPFYSYVKKNFRDINVIGSEFLGYDKKSGEILDGIRHEDALHLSFSNESFDLIISNDVYEHVPDIKRVLDEAYRILRKDGHILVSIPFYFEDQTRQRAMIENGSPKHLHPEQYHGNPMSEKGSLVFYDFGWDFINFCRSSGFRDAYMLGYYSHPHYYIGNGFQFIFVIEK